MKGEECRVSWCTGEGSMWVGTLVTVWSPARFLVGMVAMVIVTGPVVNYFAQRGEHDVLVPMFLPVSDRHL